ncbi:unnamed protein product [Cylindrotheca closterium]|uniref:Uncharacterized protein n=1 Tax=Cylindrotheca closterium TaxID=2856 RepID=A0AAD2CSN4_9STRA|nr:unnamed protein product [Cylindrotheca closterium]
MADDMMMTFDDNNEEAMAVTPFSHPIPNEGHDSFTTFKTSSDDLELDEASMTATPTTSEDWSEEYPSDEDEDDNDNQKVNGTGLILYVTPTATKAAYWKRRLGWKPNMAKTTTKKIKNIFRAPVRNHIRKGSYELNGADALAVNPKQQQQQQQQANKKPTAVGRSKKDRKWVSDESLSLEFETKDFEKLGAVNHELVFA